MIPLVPLELLAPAKTADIGIEAIRHGADAVYIGGPTFGARANAGNSLGDIERLVAYARPFGARVYAALNTILQDAELEAARQLAYGLYEAGVDALIVQDMGLLELDLPPLALHASTQCDIRTPAKAKFLADAGFSQIVLARELELAQIAEIREAVPNEVALEFFIHGALCVAYSGQCYLSQALSGRSANRGECAQPCRLPYTLLDPEGRIVAENQHLLSLKDNRQDENLAPLIAAGIRSFKIEGRYKDLDYVKNITAHYRQRLDALIDARPGLARAASGRCEYGFRPAPAKSFNRGFTDYFVRGRQPGIGAFDAPSFLGDALGRVKRRGQGWCELESSAPLANGDGLSFLHEQEVCGLQADSVRAAGPIWRVQTRSAELAKLAVGTTIHRNRDHAWEQALAKKTAERRIGLALTLAETPEGFELRLRDEDGFEACAHLALTHEPAQDAQRAEAAVREHLAKLGNTIFKASGIELDWAEPRFLPASALNAARREAIEVLLQARLSGYRRPARREPTQPTYPETELSYLGNVYNEQARAFYTKHGVTRIAPAFEAGQETSEVSLMTTKHCLRYSFGLCPKQTKIRPEPMSLVRGKETLTLRFDCKACEMHVVGKKRK